MAANEFTHIGEILLRVLKEIVQRAELRLRLDADWGRPLSDAEFLHIADQGRNERGEA